MNKMFIPFDQKFEFQLYRTDVKSDTGLHFHDCLEINYCLGGEGYLLVDGKRLECKPGSFYFINNLQVHEAVSTNNLKIMLIMFQPSFIHQNHLFDYQYIQPFYQKNIFDFGCLETQENIAEQLRELLFAMEKEVTEKKSGYRMILKAMLMQFLGLVYRSLNQKESREEEAKFHKMYHRLHPCLEYIDVHYGEEQFSLDGLASMVHMNRTYFCTYFKKVMRTGVFDYINCKRIEKACMMLTGTTQPVIKIAMECGFENISYFNRRFKQKIGMTPVQYRNESTRSIVANQ